MTSPDYHIPDGLERPSMLAAAAFLVVLAVTLLAIVDEATTGAATWRLLVYPVLTAFVGDVWYRLAREEREYRRQWAKAYRRPDWRR